MNPEAVLFEKIKIRQRFFQAAVECAVLAFILFALGCLWYPGEEWSNLTRAVTLAALVGLIGQLAAHWRSFPAASQEDLAGRWHLLREMLLPAVQSNNVTHADLVLRRRLGADLAAIMRRRRQRLVLPVLFGVFVLLIEPPSLSRAWGQLVGALSVWQPRAQITILKGDPSNPDSTTPRVIAVYRHRTPDIELLEGNLIEIATQADGNPAIELRDSSQNFVMTRSNKERGFTITLTVSRSTSVYLNGDGRSLLLANIKVQSLPVPKVTLVATAFPGGTSNPDSTLPFGGAWHDDKPLPLKISVRAEAPVAAVKLLIRSGKQESVENVLNVLSDDRREIDTDYSVTLEPYVEADESEVTIVAIATDRSVPKPLTGASDPLRITVLSSYGRYRRTLATLRELKSVVDDAAQSGKLKDQEVKKDSQRLTGLAMQQSADSPYFDALDRNDLNSFDARVGEGDESAMLELSAALGEFLFAHESIDQRERDRDFFVAMRTLSRVLQTPDQGRESSAIRILSRLGLFLDERHKFWVARVERLGKDLIPSQWPAIRDQKPFHRTIREIQGLMGGDQPRNAINRDARAQDALARIARGVAKYRVWIDELEAKEDESRKRREAERQRGLASTENELRELQRRQGEVSGGLDRAQSRQAKEVEANWPGLRTIENGNLKGTKGLEGKIRAFAPGAEARLKAAATQMQQTIEQGNAGQFAGAESSSDMAGRLLRQAEQAAQRARDSGQDRGRRRRVNGDNYYGQSIVGGDVEIKREYEVDRKYREDILDEVSRSRVDDDDKILLDRYTREVVR